MQLRRAWNWNNPRLLSKQPSQRDLSRRSFLSFCNLAQQINQRLVHFSGLGRKSGERIAEVGAVERCVFIDLARQEAFAERTVWNEADSQFLESRYHFFLRRPRPQRVFALKRGQRLDGVRAPDRLRSCFGKAEVLHLAFLNQLLHRSRHVLDRHVRIDAMLIEQINHIGPESLERTLGDLLDVLRPAIQPRRTLHSTRISSEVEPELGGDDYLLSKRSEPFADEFFICKGAINFSSIEERDAAFDGGVKKRNHLLFIFRRAVRKTHSHAAEPDRRNFQITFPKFALLHI